MNALRILISAMAIALLSACASSPDPNEVTGQQSETRHSAEAEEAPTTPSAEPELTPESTPDPAADEVSLVDQRAIFEAALAECDVMIGDVFEDGATVTIGIADVERDSPGAFCFLDELGIWDEVLTEMMEWQVGADPQLWRWDDYGASWFVEDGSLWLDVANLQLID